MPFPEYLKGSSFVCSHTLVICVKIRLDLFPNIRIQFLVRFSRKNIKSNSVSKNRPTGRWQDFNFFSGELAHTSTAWDSIPLIFAGFRLPSKIIIQFCICSRGTGSPGHWQLLLRLLFQHLVLHTKTLHQDVFWRWWYNQFKDPDGKHLLA